MKGIHQHRIRILLLAAVFAGLAAPVVAQPQLPVRMRLEPLSIRGRSGGAIPLRIKLEYNAPQIMQGDLLLKIYNSIQSSDDLMATIRYEGIVLQGTDYIFNTVLPPIEHSYNKQYLVVGWFETDSKRIPLTADIEMLDPPEPHELLTIGSFERATLVCSCSGQRDYLKPSDTRAFLNYALSLDNYNPISRTRQQGGRGPSQSELVQNYAVSWDAYDLPEDPLHLCCFDLVLLAEGALGRLEDTQMQALLTWVEAGGSLCVMPEDNRLMKPHLQFLQTLFERDHDPDLHLSITDQNSLLVISSEAEPIVNRHFGLGRATLLPNVDDLAERLTAVEIGTIVGHLWKVHRDSPVFRGENWGRPDLNDALQQRGLELVKESDGSYRTSSKSGDGRQRQYQGANMENIAAQLQLDYELQPKANPLASACETALLPHDIEMVPTSIIAVLLIAYVVMIGPVDYLVLGFFKARKYTWIMFPLVTAAFTGITIVIAHQYMSSTDTGGAISVIDVNADGRPVRQTDIQMHFYASQTALQHENSQAFAVPSQMAVSTNSNYGRQGPRSLSSNMYYSGRFPQAYTTEQNMRQWEPQIVRSMTLTPENKDVPKIDWSTSELVTSDSGRRRLGELITAAHTSDTQIDAVVLHQQSRHPLFPHGFLFTSAKINQGQNWVNMDTWQRRSAQPDHDAIASLGILQAAARTGTRDYFSIVSQVSPQGSASMEDLPVLDVSDKNQWLLIIAVRQRNTIKVFRRLYFADEVQ